MFLPACWLLQPAPPRSSVRFGPVPEDDSLGLRVESSSGQLLLAWNPHCALVENATRATLTIVDGEHNEEVDLDLGTLRNGSLVYSPITADVDFRLEVADAKRGTREAATVRSHDVSFRLEVPAAKRDGHDAATVGSSSDRLPAPRGEELSAPPGAHPGAGLEDAPLGLRVERSNGQLLLSWDRHSAPIESATQATLTIVDGDHKEDVDLDLATLRNGSIVYSPLTGDVSFRLEAADAKRGTRQAESVRLSGPAPLHAPSRPRE
jgi:hypothetical protein